MTVVDDVRELQAEVAELKRENAELRARAAQTNEQINGERGISATLTTLRKELTGEIRGLRRAAYWVAGLIVAGSVGFGFAALQIVNSASP